MNEEYKRPEERRDVLEQRCDVDLIPVEDTRRPARFTRSTRTSDAIQPVLEAIQRLGATIDRVTEQVAANHRADQRAKSEAEAEARHRELQRMVDEAGARVMRGEVRHTPSAAIRTHTFGWSK